MLINFEYLETKMVLVYDDTTGVLEHIINANTNNYMMMEYIQIGEGYEMENNNGYMQMKICNGVYVRIMELDVFVPKRIFIPANK